MKKHRYTGEFVILKRDLRKVTIDKISVDGDSYFISYFTEYNKVTYEIITESDILTEEEYDKIKDRTNKINRLFE
jgi:hypothetical protein